VKHTYLIVPFFLLVLVGCEMEKAVLEALPGKGTVVTQLELPEIPAPVYRGTPVSTIMKTVQYTGEVIWSPVTPRFFSETVYTARIILIAKRGRTFEGIQENSFVVPGAVSTNAVNSGTITAVFPATEATTDQPISLLTIPGIQTPEAGALRSTEPIDTEQYSGTISWSPDYYRFYTDTVYTARISLLDKEGWRLQGVETNSFVVPGAITTNRADSGEIRAVFPRTASTVTLSEIPAINVTAGAFPPGTITETEQFSGTISWTPDDEVFAEDTDYTAEISIIGKEGWTTWGVQENFFRIEGAIVTNKVNSGVVTALFSDIATITISEIPGIPVPVTGEPQTTPLIDTEQYTGTISWSKPADFFASDTYYDADIVLTAKDGWTFLGLPGYFFTVNGATSVYTKANSNEVSVSFPKTEYVPSSITQLDIPGIQIPEYRIKPSSQYFFADQYYYFVTWSPSLDSDSRFSKKTVYTATIDIYPFRGWTVNGLPGNAFRVEGAVTTTYEAGSDRITAVFPSTGD